VIPAANRDENCNDIVRNRHPSGQLKPFVPRIAGVTGQRMLPGLVLVKYILVFTFTYALCILDKIFFNHMVS